MAGKAALVSRRKAPSSHDEPATSKGDRAFLLSRIYARGWNIAKSLSADRLDGLDGDGIATMNPYQNEDERQRWQEGFAAGAIR